MSLSRTTDSEPLADHLEELVAGRVAEDVVDALEAVEVDEVQREGVVAAPRARDLAAQAVAQERPVRQVGQRVVMGEMDTDGFQPACGR